jgi:hypothetical protein
MNATDEGSRVRDEVIEQGRQIYRDRLKTLLEPGENGRFVAIEATSRGYFVGGTGGEALQAAHEAMPHSQFYLKRIGSAVTYRLGGYGNRQRSPISLRHW